MFSSDSIGAYLTGAAAHAQLDLGSFDLGNVGDLAVDAAVNVGIGYLSVAAGPLGKITGEAICEAIKQVDFGKMLGGDSKTIGQMDQKEFFDAFKNVIAQLARDGQKETRKKGGEDKCEGGGDGGASLRDLAEALGKAVSERVAAAKELVSGLTSKSDQGEILEATSEVGAAGFLATSAGGAMQAAIQGANKLASPT